jgi:hypothetical protein
LGWLWQEVSEDLLARFHADAWVSEQRDDLQSAVASGKMTPAMAAESLLKGFLDRTQQNCVNVARDEEGELLG